MSEIEVNVTPDEPTEEEAHDAPVQNVVVENPAPESEVVDPEPPSRDEALAEHRLHHEGLERHIDEKFDEVLGLLSEHTKGIADKFDEHGRKLDDLTSSSHVHEEEGEAVSNANDTLITPEDLSASDPAQIVENPEKKVSKARRWGF